LILCRQPSADERVKCLAFLKHQPQLFANRAKLTPFAGGVAATIKPSDDPATRARENLIHVLLNTSEFITVR
jgi:uracil-DNA glycosylase